MGGMTTERSEVVKSEERESTCRDELMVVARDSANVIDEVDVGKSMGVNKLEIASDVVGGLTVERESVGKRKSMLVANKSLDVEGVSSAVLESVVATKLVAETAGVVYRDGEPRMDGLSMQEETTSEIEKSKDIAVPTYR